MLIKDTEQWANELFGHADLGDKRRTERLVKLGHQMATHTGSSIVKAAGDQASIEGAYRFIRNDSFDAADIATSGFDSLLPQLGRSTTILALEDTSTLNYRHNVTKELGSTGANPKSKTKGILAHSVLMVDADNEQTIGLGEQRLWCRTAEDFGQAKYRRKRLYTSKESYKWQRASEALSKRYAPVIKNIISVCDRESDLFEYIAYKQENQQRFVVRANHDRALLEKGVKLSEFISEQSSAVSYQVKIKQKGGRKSRIANVSVRFATVTIGAPKKSQSKSKPVTLTLISCDEISPPDGVTPLCWRLYTNEPIDTVENSLKIIRYYELRWRVEEFHKAWKSAGTQVESLRLQSRSNLEKMIVITAFVAIRLLQLRELVTEMDKAKEVNCQQFFSKLEWRLLWSKTEMSTLPKEPPSLHWAYYALAKLGRWHDSKRTGIVGWQALWCGWLKLMQLTEGAEFILQQTEDM